MQVLYKDSFSVLRRTWTFIFDVIGQISFSTFIIPMDKTRHGASLTGEIRKTFIKETFYNVQYLKSIKLRNHSWRCKKLSV